MVYKNRKITTKRDVHKSFGVLHTYCTHEDFCAISKHLWNWSNYIPRYLRGVITSPCPRYRPHKSSHHQCPWPWLWGFPLQWRHNGRDGVSITSLAIVYSTVYSGADQRKYQSSASLAFMRVIHRWAVNSPHKWPVTRKMFPFDDVIMDSM